MGALLSLIEAVPPVSDFETKKRSQPPIQGNNSNPASESGRLPYWQVNIPFERREKQCPGFLRDIGERNERMVGTPASQFHYHNWEEVKTMIGSVRDSALCHLTDSERHQYHRHVSGCTFGSSQIPELHDVPETPVRECPEFRSTGTTEVEGTYAGWSSIQ